VNRQLRQHPSAFRLLVAQLEVVQVAEILQFAQVERIEIHGRQVSVCRVGRQEQRITPVVAVFVDVLAPVVDFPLSALPSIVILLLFVEHPLDFAVAHGHADYVIQHFLRDERLGRQIQRLPQRRTKPSHQHIRAVLVGNPRFRGGALFHRREVGDEISVQADVFQLRQALKAQLLQAGDAVAAKVDVRKGFGQGRLANHHARQVARGNQQIAQIGQAAHEMDVLHADMANVQPHEVLRVRQRRQIQHKRFVGAFVAVDGDFLQLRHFAQQVVSVRDNRAIPLPDALCQPRAAQFVNGHNGGIFGHQLPDRQVRQRG